MKCSEFLVPSSVFGAARGTLGFHRVYIPNYQFLIPNLRARPDSRPKYISAFLVGVC